MEVGVVGKPNVGKSTFFNALTLLDAAIAPYPFTTIAPNRGVGAVRVPCPHPEGSGAACSPGNARCVGGTRWVPINLVDVPGLVPGAAEGKGLGHRFLDDLRAADGFVQVVDASGATSPDGTLGAPGSTDPADEVGWLLEELTAWVAEILGRDFDRHARSTELEGTKVEEFLAARLTGLSIQPPALSAALRLSGLDPTHPASWSAVDRRRLAAHLLEAAKPRLVAANKIDKSTETRVRALADAVAPIPVVPCAADAELTLRRASRAGLVEYAPGASSFSVPDPARLSTAQERALESLRSLLVEWGSTGVQRTLEAMIFERLHYIVVFPVEDETHWTDSKGRRLPDAFLVPAETPAKEFAYRVHSDLGDRFIRAIDGRTHRALGADQPLANGAVVRIVARR